MPLIGENLLLERLLRELKGTQNWKDLSRRVFTDNPEETIQLMSGRGGGIRNTDDLPRDIARFIRIVKKQRKEKEHEDLKTLHSERQAY